MKVIGVTQDGVIHNFVNGKWEPPIIVPTYIHDRALRRVNEVRMKKSLVEEVKP